MPKIKQETGESGNLLWRHAYQILKSELDGLYDEIDKLCKKAPLEPASKLQTDAVNSIIKKIKTFLVGDIILKEVNVFVSAGDNPEYRDIVTVLRQLRQSLERFHNKYNDTLFSWDFNAAYERANIDDSEASKLFLSEGI